MKKDKENQKIIDSYDYLSNAASSQDLTGLIPSAPISTDEIESYKDVYQFLPPDGDASMIQPDVSLNSSSHSTTKKPGKNHTPN